MRIEKKGLCVGFYIGVRVGGLFPFILFFSVGETEQYRL